MSEYDRVLSVVRLTAPVPAEGLEDALVEHLERVSVWEDVDLQCITVEQYFESGSEAAAAVVHLREVVIPAVGLVDFELEVVGLRPEDWRDAWKQNFKTERVSEHVVITPPWENYEALESDCVVEINPGLSFGTGQHATTKCCLRMLDRVAQQKTGVSLLDVGCGSGILSIAAVQLGYCPVVAIDNDPQSMLACRSNFDANDVAGFIDLQSGRLEDVSTDRTFDVVVANLIPNTDELFARQLARFPALRGGTAILSGILTDKYLYVASIWNGLGFRQMAHIEMDEWSTGLFVRDSSQSCDV